MKVGDLVALSQYGKNVKRTGWIQHGDIGVVKYVRTSIFVTYEVMWNKSRWKHKYGYQRRLDRKDLKFVK